MCKKVVKLGAIILILAAVFWFTYRAETETVNSQGSSTEQVSRADGNEQPEEKKKKIKYWVAPMDPNYIRNEPGKSPMGMDLVPVYEDEGEKSSEGVIKIDPVTVQTIGVRTAAASKGLLHKAIRTVGRITYDEKLVEHIHTKVSGWVEKLYIDTTGEEVRKGQELLSLYSPDLVTTQEEYLQALKYRDRTSGSAFPEVAEGGSTLVEAARKRLLYMDMDAAQIDALEKTREVRKNITLHSPANGIVMKKNVVDGMKVDLMSELYTIADISRVWVIASVYEYELPFIKTGQEVEMTLSYDPAARYKGRVTFIYPYLSEKTRTIQIRMEFDNPGMKLKPDMYTDVVIEADSGGESVIVPTESVIRTGTRNVIITSLGKGRFLPKEVVTGLEGEGIIQVLEGLEEGAIVVTSGQFLIDSESNLREAVNKMLESRMQQEEDGAHDADSQVRSEEMAVSGSDARLSEEQKSIVSDLIEHYLKVHEALVSESGSAVAEKTHEMHSVLDRLRDSDREGQMKEITAAMDDSMEGLHSGDLQTARTSFKTLSRIMTGLVRGSAREEAIASGIKIYFCPMENEPWIQKGGELRNPYLGKDMWICGNEEKL